MTKQQRIQAAIDALPHATGGEWKNFHDIGDRRHFFSSVHAFSDEHGCTVTICRPMTDGRDGPVLSEEEQCYNATVLVAAKDLAEEVVRLRAMVAAAFGAGYYAGGGLGCAGVAWQASPFARAVLA